MSNTTTGAIRKGQVKISLASLTKGRRPAVTRTKPSGEKSERDNFLSYARHVVLNSALVAITVQGGQHMVSSSMKISSMCEHVIAAYEILKTRKYPEGLGADDAGFEVDGKKRWDVAIAKTIRSADDALWFFPSEGLLLSDSALEKLYEAPVGGGAPLIGDYLAARDAHLKKHVGVAMYIDGAFPRTVEKLKVERGINLTLLSHQPDFVKTMHVLACACHSMTGPVACRNLAENAITRDPVSMMDLNPLLSNYTDPTEVATDAKTRLGGVYTTALRALQSVKAQTEANGKLGNTAEHKTTIFEVADSTAHQSYCVRTSFRAAAPENLTPKFPKDVTQDTKEKRISIDTVLQKLAGGGYAPLASNLRKELVIQINADAAKTTHADGSHAGSVSAEEVNIFLQNVYFTHISVRLPAQERIPYSAAFMVFTKGAVGSGQLAINLSAMMMLYFFFRRFGMEVAASEVKRQVLDAAFTNDPVHKTLFDHLVEFFQVQREIARPRGAAFTGITAVSGDAIAKYEAEATESKRGVRAAAHQAGNRSPSPPARGAAGLPASSANWGAARTGSASAAAAPAGGIAERAWGRGQEQRAPSVAVAEAASVWGSAARTGSAARAGSTAGVPSWSVPAAPASPARPHSRTASGSGWRVGSASPASAGVGSWGGGGAAQAPAPAPDAGIWGDPR